MDYEKAYKAALETATQWIKDGCTDKEKICLESCFSELRESEYERIRKAIIHMLERRTQQFYEEDGISKSDMFAWLEKQKECVTDSSKTPTDEDERMRKAALEGIGYLEHELMWDFIGDIDILDVKEYLEKQKEQKPFQPKKPN